MLRRKCFVYRIYIYIYIGLNCFEFISSLSFLFMPTGTHVVVLWYSSVAVRPSVDTMLTNLS